MAGIGKAIADYFNAQTNYLNLKAQQPIAEAYAEGVRDALAEHDCSENQRDRISELQRQINRLRGNSVTLDHVTYTLAKALGYEKPEEVVDTLGAVEETIKRLEHMQSQLDDLRKFCHDDFLVGKILDREPEE